MKTINLGKLIKKRMLGTLLTQLEILVGLGVSFDLFDIRGQSLLNRPDLSPAQIKRVLDARQVCISLPAETKEGADENHLALVLALEKEPVGILLVTIQQDCSLLDLQARLAAVGVLLEQLATMSLANRTLAAETLERYREINLLYGIQEAIGTQLDISQISDLVLNESIRVIKAQSGVILLADSGLDSQVIMSSFAVQARYGQVALAESVLAGDTIAGWVVVNQRAAIVNQVAGDERCGALDRQAKSLLCVPLAVGQGLAMGQSSKILGAICLYDKLGGDIFTASDQKLLIALASQSAIAIETAREVNLREDRLKQQIHALRIEIDKIRQKHQVDSITETDYFSRLQQNAEQMRREFGEF